MKPNFGMCGHRTCTQGGSNVRISMSACLTAPKLSHTLLWLAEWQMNQPAFSMIWSDEAPSMFLLPVVDNAAGGVVLPASGVLVCEAEDRDRNRVPILSKYLPIRLGAAAESPSLAAVARVPLSSVNNIAGRAVFPEGAAGAPDLFLDSKDMSVARRTMPRSSFFGSSTQPLSSPGLQAGGISAVVMSPKCFSVTSLPLALRTFNMVVSWATRMPSNALRAMSASELGSLVLILLASS